MSNKFNESAVSSIDQGTVEHDGAQYPAISFHNGDPTKKNSKEPLEYQGGWFIAEDGSPADMTDFGWERGSFTNRDGEEITGFWAPSITVSVIRQRRRWLVNGQPYPWNKFEDAKEAGSPRGHQQFLVLLKGAEELGPFVLGLKGHAGMAFFGSRQYASSGCLSTFNRTVIACANARTKPAKWPYRAFWLTTGAGKDDKGRPAFIEVGKTGATSKIVVPVPVGLPEKASEVDLDQFYIGDEALPHHNQLYDEAEAWATAWDSATSTTNGNGKAEPEVAADEDVPEGM